MKKIETLLVGLIVSLVFTQIAVTSSSDSSYDPWLDLNDDGVIDVFDLHLLSLIYGTIGTPINKTELLLELEARIDSLNATLLTEYYNITDCDSLFALLAHLHSASDISGGTLSVDQIRLGSTEGNSIIYFYEDGVPTGEFIYWWNSGDAFQVSDDIYILGNMEITGTIDIPTTTRYYSVPGCAWLPARDWYVFEKSTTYLWTNTDGDTYWYQPVDLPHGAVITEFSVWVYDADTTYDIDVKLWCQQPSTVMASITSSGDSGYAQYSDSSIYQATVDNQNNSYIIQAILRQGGIWHQLGRVRITYTITEPLP